MEKKKNTRVAHIREILTKKKMQKIENIPTFNQKLKKKKSWSSNLCKKMGSLDCDLGRFGKMERTLNASKNK